VSLVDWLNEKLISPHNPTPDEIAALLHICDRDLEKVKIIELGPDWRLSIAHNAALKAATAALAASGYKALFQLEKKSTLSHRPLELKIEARESNKGLIYV
jgi:hypothetical protein